MLLNIHPLLVHFPIGLLTLYTFFEVARVRVLTKQSYYFPLKAILVIFGTIGGVASILSGLWIKSSFMIGGDIGVVMAHEDMGYRTMVVYGCIAVIYFFQWIERSMPQSAVVQHIVVKTAIRWSRTLAKPAFLVVLSIIGFTLLSLTGALGGSIALGPETDPFASFLYHYFSTT